MGWDPGRHISAHTGLQVTSALTRPWSWTWGTLRSNRLYVLGDPQGYELERSLSLTQLLSDHFLSVCWFSFEMGVLMWALWFMPTIPALNRWKLEDQESKIFLVYTV